MRTTRASRTGIESLRAAATRFLIAGNMKATAHVFEMLGRDAQDADALETAARIYRDAKRMPEAMAQLQKAIDLSRGKAPKEYTENLEKEWAAWKTMK